MRKRLGQEGTDRWHSFNYTSIRKVHVPKPKRVDSVEQFIEIAAELRDRWMGLSDMSILPWFRGQENADWDLAPILFT